MNRKAITFAYHDVTGEKGINASGYCGWAAERYKIKLVDFRAQLDTLAAVFRTRPVRATELEEETSGTAPFLLTFDDGGISALDIIAEELEERGWRGNFFIPAADIGRPGFLTGAQIRTLRQRGHLIGSHGYRHGLKMPALSLAELVGEWRKSVEILAGIIGEPITAAAAPGGYYSGKVARAASAAGLSVLFTSAPTRRFRMVHGCLILGRYAIRRGLRLETVTGLAEGRRRPRLGQKAAWVIKGAAKFFNIDTVLGYN
jgi:peptidoglycan/xylan/chitin deacetylase (PgdA/CDA1 family)